MSQVRIRDDDTPAERTVNDERGEDHPRSGGPEPSYTLADRTVAYQMSLSFRVAVWPLPQIRVVRPTETITSGCVTTSRRKSCSAASYQDFHLSQWNDGHASNEFVTYSLVHRGLIGGI